MTRRILFCTIGQTPQVVTETVWALLRHRTPPWLPDEVHVVTTTVGLPRVQKTLQDPSGYLAPLFSGRPPPLTIHVPCRSGRADIYQPLHAAGDWQEASGASGASSGPPLSSADALADVNSEEDAAIMGDLILQLIARFARDPDTEIHLSLAGGRKTMSAHALLALTILGRPRDQASHVLVTPVEFEDHFEFWHPEQGGTIRPKGRSGDDRAAAAPPLDPAKARVTLVPTPTLLLRYRVRNDKELETLRLTDIVKEHNLGALMEQQPRVSLHSATNTLDVYGIRRRLTARSFALYRLIATARIEDWPGIGADGTGAATGTAHSGWLSIPQICMGRSSHGRIDRTFLSMVREAIEADGRDTDPERNTAVKAWQDICDRVPDVREKIELAKAILQPRLTTLRNELRRGFGSSVAAMLFAPKNREDGDINPVVGIATEWIRAPRFGITIPPADITID